MRGRRRTFQDPGGDLSLGDRPISKYIDRRNNTVVVLGVQSHVYLLRQGPKPQITVNMDDSGNKRSTSQSRNRPSSRPTTPLRPSSRTSLRDGQGFAAGSVSSEFPLESLEPAFAELSDSMADLEANFMHLQLMHESLSRFNESFASFLYGMNMNAFCVDFPEVRTCGSAGSSHR